MTSSSDKSASRLNRRQVLSGAGSLAAFSIAAPASWGQNLFVSGGGHVVVAGAGFAGSTIARYLALWGGPGLKVTLIDPKSRHVSCVMSNLYLDGSLTYGALNFAHRLPGVDFVRDKVIDVDPAGKNVLLASGGWMSYDRLVLSGGISFKPIDGWNPVLAPHAWVAGSQSKLLKQNLRSMPRNASYAMTIPKSPYRCPPGPYERACTIAHILKLKGGSPKLLVLDANAGIQAEKVTFERAFNEVYGDIIEYIPNAELQSIDHPNGWIHTSAGSYRVDGMNIIPNQRASGLVRRLGLARRVDWAPVDPISYESTQAGFEGIHVIGDSQGTGQPKSGHMANAQAKVCADAILRSLNGERIDTPDRLAAITTNSACFSPITPTEASWLTVAYQYDPASGSMVKREGSLAEAGRWTSRSYNDMFTWAHNLWADTFGV